LVAIGPEMRAQRAQPARGKPEGLDGPADEGENDEREPDRDEQQASASHRAGGKSMVSASTSGRRTSSCNPWSEELGASGRDAGR